MTLPQAQPVDANGTPIKWIGWDASGGQFVVAEAGAGVAATGQAFDYAPLHIQQKAAVTTSKTLQDAAAATGDGTVFSIDGMSTVAFTLSTTGFSGTVLFEGSSDGVIYSDILATELGTTTVATGTGSLTTDTSTSIWIAEVSGLSYVKAPIARSAGSITITAKASPLSNAVPVGSTIGTAVIQANSGTALAADVSNSELRVSAYVKASAAGDTALTLGQTTKAASLPTTLASDDSRASADAATAANILEAVQGRFNGATVDRVRTFTKILNIDGQAITSDTPVDVLTPTAGKKFRVIAYHLTNDANKGAIQIQSVSGTNLLVVPSGSASPDLGVGVPADAADHHMFLDATDTGNVSGWIGYSEE